jgi:hypothetical protein
MRMKYLEMPFHPSVFTEQAPIKIWGTQMGGMLIARHDFYPGTDVTPLLATFPTGLCPVPHWGYCFRGEMIMLDQWLRRGWPLLRARRRAPR